MPFPMPCRPPTMCKTPQILTALCLFSGIAAADYRTFDDQEMVYGVFHADPAQIHLHWKDQHGKNYGFLPRLKSALQPNYQVKMLMNGGIYRTDGTPAGLWIEQGKMLNPLNAKRGKGNFHVQPNGVFAVTESQRAVILTTAEYQKAALKPRIALQSGPMLLISGKINPQFKPNKASFHKRNAVCVTAKGQIRFVMTLQGKPNLYRFSQGLQKIGCRHALYLDGTLSDWYIPGHFSGWHWRHFVGMISVLEPIKK